MILGIINYGKAKNKALLNVVVCNLTSPNSVTALTYARSLLVIFFVIAIRLVDMQQLLICANVTVNDRAVSKWNRHKILNRTLNPGVITSIRFYVATSGVILCWSSGMDGT
jgi:hypothetical protein